MASNFLHNLIKRPTWRTTACVVAVAIVAGCKKPAPPQAPPPAAVTVSTPILRDVIEWDVYTGHLEAPESVQVEARVSGMLIAAPFIEGSVVKKGQVLFEIDPRPFQADIDSKRADVAKARAQVDVAQSNFDREALALSGNAVSKQDYDNAKATLEQAQAAQDGAKAAIENSQLNLDWCHVTSPVSGRVSYKNVTIGNLVNGGPGQPTDTLLTTVQSVDPMYCYVDVDENSVLKYQKLAMERKRASSRDTKIVCYVRLGNETNFPHKGYIDFVDNHVDTSTGTLRARGVLPNPTGNLTPGFFASMRVPGSAQYQALLVPDSAVLTDQDRRDVLVVGSDNTVQPRQVQLGALFGQLRAIASGLGPDDRVIINGQMHARPGAPVTPTDGKIDVDPNDFAETAGSAAPAESATQNSETDPNSLSADAAKAATNLRDMENGGTAVAVTQPAQPIMAVATPSTGSSDGTAFTTPGTADSTTMPTSTPATAPASAPTSAVGAGQ